jgi:nitroreductase
MKPIPAATAPHEEIAAFLIEAASWAPSVHNTQPWWFGVREAGLSLHADVDRRLDVADPDGREMLISCGAALFTLCLAARRLGLVTEVRLLPDSDRPGLMADVDIAVRRAVMDG